MAPSRNVWINIYQGDKASYEEVFVYYFGRYCNYGKKFTDNITLIEDAAQETMLAIWNKREVIPSIEKIAAYFYTSYRFILFNKLKQVKLTVGEDQIQDDPQFSIDQIIVKNELDAELKSRLKTALANLTDRQREAIFLKFYEGLSYDEIATL
ncbi:MAG: RNA polymerase sigma factor [Ginsengibacter sp.]